MGDKLILTAALQKGDQQDTLILENGITIPLPGSLDYPAATKLVVTIMPADQTEPNLAKQLLQEILNGQ